MVSPSAGSVVLVTFPLSGSLQRISFARHGKLFTANASLMRAEVGRLAPDGFRRIRRAVLHLFRDQESIQQ